MIHKKIIELALTPLEQKRYHPPKGINISWIPKKEDDKDPDRITSFIAIFLAEDASLEIDQAKNINDINTELDRLKPRILNELSSHPLAKGRHREEMIMNHPLLMTGKGRWAAANSPDVHDVFLTKEELEQAKLAVKNNPHIKDKTASDTIRPRAETNRTIIKRLGDYRGIEKETSETLYVLEVGSIVDSRF